MNREYDLRLALGLTYITLAWMTIEGAASLLLGWASKSLLLEAFGIDSVVELFSGFVLLWRLRVELTGSASAQYAEEVERRAARYIGYSLYVLAAYVLLNSYYGLFVAKRVTDTHESAWGILIGVVAKIGMPILAGYKLKVAARLNSRALRADAVESITCGYLSIVLMLGLAATRVLGWWWLDSVAALALIPFLIKEGREAVRGDGCCGLVSPVCDFASEHLEHTMPAMKQKVLCICVHNSARSQMAEAWMNQVCGDVFEAQSAGLEAGMLNPLVMQAMEEVGVDLSEKGTQTVIDVLRSDQKFRYVITVCSDADAKGCPLFPGVATRLHWPFPDPSLLTGTDEEKLRAIREIRDDIRTKIEEWCEQVCPKQVTEMIDYT